VTGPPRRWLAALVVLALAAGCSAGEETERPRLDGLRRGAEQALRRARDLRERARRFDAEAALAALPPSRRSGPSVRLDERVSEARVLSGGESVPDAAPCAACLRFEFEGRDPIPLQLVRGEGHVEEGVLVLDARDGDFLLAHGFDLKKSQVAAIELRARVEKPGDIELAWNRKDLDAWPEAGDPRRAILGRVAVHVLPSADFRTYRLDARTVLRRYGQRMRSFLVLPAKAGGGRVEIDSIRFVGARERYAGRAFGTTYERRRDELRPALFANAPLRLGFSLRVPERAPAFSTGMAVLEGGPGADFRVRLVAGDQSTELLRRRVEPDDAWVDARADLSAWAGRDVELRLEVASEGPAVALWSSPVVVGAPLDPLNVIVVLQDALRADHLSAYGHRPETSPALAEWSRRGVRFEHAFSQATKTRPSCPSLMTSLPPTAAGVWSFNERLDERYLTLAEILRSQGFATAAFVQNANAGPAAGLHQGYDAVFDHLRGGSSAVLGERARAWVSAHRDRNFYLYLHVLDPHGAFDPPAPYDRWYREAAPGTPVEPDPRPDPPWVEAPTLEGRRLRYDGEIRHNDALLGDFLRALEAQGVLDRTLLVFLADHGEFLGEHDLWEHHPPSYVQVLRVPLVMVHPRELPAGRVLRQPVALLDVVPTILDLAGIDTPGLLLAGDSLLPLVRGDGEERFAGRVVLSEESGRYRRGGGGERVSASLIQGDLHVLQSLLRPEAEFYTYAEDPQEERPLADPALRDAAAEIATPALRELKQLHLEVWRSITGGETAPVIERDPEAEEQLRALGYIE
jgi:arylsulfatase A-like enzyme